MILETERLILRPITPDDAEAMFYCCKDVCVGKNAGWKPHESLNETREMINEFFMKEEHCFGIVRKSDNVLMGSAGLATDSKRENEKVKMLGYSLGADYWGNGYMTEAATEIIGYGFAELELDLISAYTYPHNERSKNVLRKCGFALEGTLRLCERIYSGEVYDNECWYLSAVRD